MSSALIKKTVKRIASKKIKRSLIKILAYGWLILYHCITRNFTVYGQPNTSLGLFRSIDLLRTLHSEIQARSCQIRMVIRQIRVPTYKIVKPHTKNIVSQLFVFWVVIPLVQLFLFFHAHPSNSNLLESRLISKGSSYYLAPLPPVRESSLELAFQSWYSIGHRRASSPCKSPQIQ